jgi:hypothetical protein
MLGLLGGCSPDGPSPLEQAAVYGAAAVYALWRSEDERSPPPARSVTGTLRCWVRWPARVRLVPQLTDRLVIEVSHNPRGTVTTQTLHRPSNGGDSVAIFTGLPAGTLAIAAWALPGIDGAGPPVGMGSQSVRLPAGGDVSVELAAVIRSTIEHLQPVPYTLALGIGQAARVGIIAYDGAGRVVPVAADAVRWTARHPGLVRVDADGHVRGLAPGDTTLEAEEIESGLTTRLPVRVGRD